MRILLTNDDGIYAQGIAALYKELKKIGQVTVVAPKGEQSSVGHGITLTRPIWFEKVKRKNGLTGYAITGTPADCVKFATGVLLKKKPDFVVSGINLGANDGCSVFYSGTVAGAREGAMMGIPSVAVSLATFIRPDFTYAAKVGRKVVELMSRSPLTRNTFLNVNVPARKLRGIKGVKVTRQGMIPIHGTFRKRVDPHARVYYWMSGKVPVRTKDLDVDTDALTQGYVTVTPIHCDMTHYETLDQIRAWRM